MKQEEQELLIKKLGVEQLGSMHVEFNAFSIKCVNNKGKDKTYNITIGKEYLVRAVIIEEEFIKYVITNDIGIDGKYVSDYFTITESDTINETLEKELFTCPQCNLVKHLRDTREIPNNEWLSVTTVSGEIVNINKICTSCFNKLKLLKCEKFTECKYQSIFASNFTKINNRTYCAKCFEQMKLLVKDCTVCDNKVMKEDDKQYNGLGTLCRQCYDSGFERDYANIWNNKGKKLLFLTSKNNTFNTYPDRTFGLEFEMVAKKNYLKIASANIVEKLLQEKVTSNHSLLDFLEAHHDGSLTRNIGIEITAGVLKGDKGAEILSNVISILKQEFTTDDTCGLHIHLGVDDFSEDELIDLYYVYQQMDKYFKYFIDNRRLTNRYCVPLKKFSKKDLSKKTDVIKFKDKDLELKKSCQEFYKQIRSDRDRGNQEHYGKVNFSSVREHNTLEIRIMDGNLDTERILEWLRFHLQIIEWTKDHAGKLVNQESKLNVRNILGEGLYALLVEKIKLFNDGKLSYAQKGVKAIDNPNTNNQVDDQDDFDDEEEVETDIF